MLYALFVIILLIVVFLVGIYRDWSHKTLKYLTIGLGLSSVAFWLVGLIQCGGKLIG